MRDSVNVGVVKRFSEEKRPEPLGVGFTEAGVRWRALELSSLELWETGRTQRVVLRTSSGCAGLDELGFDAVVWRVSENETVTCEALLDAVAAAVPVVVNHPHMIKVCSSKWATNQTLLAAGVPTIPTVYLAPGGNVPELGGRVVVKPDRGAGGRGVRFAEPGEVGSNTEPMVAQRYMGDPASHRRVLVCNGVAVGAAVRRSSDGSLANNLSAGGVAEVVALGDEAAVAEDAAAAFNAVLAGVDLVPDAGGWRVLEVNSAGGMDAFIGTSAIRDAVTAVLDAAHRQL